MSALITQHERVMPHLHLSLQSGDNMILKRMKRRHSREQAIALIQRIKAARPETAIGADIIAGFPTESRSEEHTSELQSLMRSSYAVFFLQKKSATVAD